MRATRVLTGTIAMLASAFVSLHAQDPSARVARASYLQGEVSFRPGTVDDWTSATLNYPLSTGDHLWTDNDARAELHIGSTAIRLGPETAFEILSLDDDHVQINLTQGSALIRVRALGDNDNYEIDTPTGAVSLLRTGTYRVDVSGDGATSTVTVRGGAAEVTSNNNTIPVRAEQTVLFTVDGASPDVRQAAPFDEYDQWAADRDRRDDQSASAQYVSRDMTGYEDLDANGTWDNDAQYGHVWIPAHVESGWAPYRYGRWAWVEPWGWTWIDDAPWGFAPFHYGRWAYVRERWVWAPGRVVERPVYAPALVAFVGGSHFSVSVHFGQGGGVAWFPLAPDEVYRPAYHVSDRYVERVNVTNVHVTNINVTNVNVTNVNVTNVHYRNQDVAGGVTAVSQEQFSGSRRIGRDAVIVPVGEARSAQVVGHGAPVTPTQQSVLVRQTVNVRRPPETVVDRTVVYKTAPPPRPATFASHVAQLQTTGDKPVTPLTVSQTRGAPRTNATQPMSHTTTAASVANPTGATIPARAPVNAQTNAPVNGAANTQEHVVAPAPNTNTRPGQPVVRPNINVRAQPNAQPNQGLLRPNDSVHQNTNVHPSTSTAPGTSDRPLLQNTHPVVQPNHAPAQTQVDTQQRRPLVPSTTNNRPPTAQTGEAKRQADVHAKNDAEKRRVQAEHEKPKEEKPKDEHQDKPPRRR